MPDTATHPLATRGGIDAILRIVEAKAVWRQATVGQRALLAELCAPTVRAAMAVGALRDCLAWAIAAGCDHGVWGGWTAPERKTLTIVPPGGRV